MSGDPQRDPTPDAVTATGATSSAPELHRMAEPPSETMAGGLPDAVMITNADECGDNGRSRFCVLCGRRLASKQPRHAYAGGEAHRRCYDKHRRPASAHMAVPAQPRQSADAMQDGLHALSSAAQLLLQ